jgi:hypothetical protein
MLESNDKCSQLCSPLRENGQFLWQSKDWHIIEGIRELTMHANIFVSGC